MFPPGDGDRAGNGSKPVALSAGVKPLDDWLNRVGPRLHR